MAGFMPFGDFKVTYTNGETTTAVSNFRGLVEIERRWPGQNEAPGIEATGVAVWFYLGCPGDSFDDWLGTVHLIEPATTNGLKDENDRIIAEAVDPTVPTAGVA